MEVVEMKKDKSKVCVTGGTGFIASWLIMRLLQNGYSVQTTVRSDPGLEHKRDLSFLTNLPGAPERLQIFHADLNDPESFDAAIAGCTGVFHVATPLDFAEPEESATQKARNGMIGILKSCLKAETVKRIVYTSSGSTAMYSEKISDIVDETFWSDVDNIRKYSSYGSAYVVSKTLTERAALEFAEEHGLDLVTLLPSLVVGPFICPKFVGSIRSALALVLGNREEYGFLVLTQMVHVDDLAQAHIFLLEYPEAKGRYICSSDQLTIKEMAEFLSGKYPEYPIPTADSLAKIEGYRMPVLSSTKLLDTGFRYKYGINEMFDGAIQCCKDRGYL